MAMRLHWQIRQNSTLFLSSQLFAESSIFPCNPRGTNPDFPICWRLLLRETHKAYQRHIIERGLAIVIKGRKFPWGAN
jgi:hypothetical protein